MPHSQGCFSCGKVFLLPAGDNGLMLGPIMSSIQSERVSGLPCSFLTYTSQRTNHFHLIEWGGGRNNQVKVDLVVSLRSGMACGKNLVRHLVGL